MFQWLFAPLRAWRAWQRYLAEEGALQRFGWAGTCPHCDADLHTTPSTVCVGETMTHWHYRCGACGGMSHWNLVVAPLPMIDMRRGAQDWAEYQEGKDSEASP